MEKIYIQITSGRGPVECCRVVMFITKKMIEQIKGLGYEVEIVEHEDGPEYGCMFSVTLSVEGENIMSLKDEWEGSVLWVAQKNPFRPWHRRKNWFVGVHFFSPLLFNKRFDLSFCKEKCKVKSDELIVAHCCIIGLIDHFCHFK